MTARVEPEICSRSRRGITRMTLSLASFFPTVDLDTSPASRLSGATRNIERPYRRAGESTKPVRSTGATPRPARAVACPASARLSPSPRGIPGLLRAWCVLDKRQEKQLRCRFRRSVRRQVRPAELAPAAESAARGILAQMPQLRSLDHDAPTARRSSTRRSTRRAARALARGTRFAPGMDHRPTKRE